MTAASQHPVVLAFDNLLALRRYAGANPRDVAGKFATYCAANLMHSCRGSCKTCSGSFF